MTDSSLALAEPLVQEASLSNACCRGRILTSLPLFIAFGFAVLFSWTHGQNLVQHPAITIANRFQPLPTITGHGHGYGVVVPTAFKRFQTLPIDLSRLRSLSTTSSHLHSRPATSSRSRLLPSAIAADVQPLPDDIQLTPAPVKVLAPLACPVSFQKLDSNGFCPRSGLQYAKEDGRWDLRIGAAINTANTGPTSITDVARSFLPKELRGFVPESRDLGTSTFENPQVAYAYERGWRQGFSRAGFPGADEEFKLAEMALLPSAEGKVLADVSCGSGLFTRRFAKSSKYGHVIALDFSDAMLRQARTFASEAGLTDENLTFVRADIARLPFPEGSIAGIHAGAAIHCWPDPRTAVAEIARVLEPGATFCGTTFLSPRIPFVDENVQQAVDSTVRDLAGRGSGRTSLRYWSRKDLSDLMKECGLVDFQGDVRSGRGPVEGFIFYRATKPVRVNSSGSTSE